MKVENKNIMKKLNIFFILSLLVAMVSCDPLDDLKDEYTEEAETFAYTLTDDDYETIADKLLYFEPGETVNAAFIENYKYFTDSISAATYVPYFLDATYPGKIVGTTFNVTVNYNESMTDDLSQYADANIYVLTESDYSDNGYDGYFTPGTDADGLIPTILSNNISKPADDTIVVASYVQPTDEDEAYDLTTTVNEEFSSDAGSFQVINVTGDDQEWEWGTGSMSIEGYDEGYYDNEDWLVSPEIDLSGTHSTKLLFENAVDEYVEGYIAVLISEDFDGEDVTSATWNDIEVPQWDTIPDRPSGIYKNIYVESGTIDLSGYDGKKVYIAFKYTSDKAASIAPIWSISYVNVGSYYWTYDDYYQYDGSNWEKLDNVHKITAYEYDQFGSPGTYDNFSSSIDPQDYIPTLLDNMYPLAGEGTASQFMVYKYYSSAAGSVLTLADEYTKTTEGWESSYSFVTETTDPFKKSTSGWVFDPTVIETMDADDYQIIVDYVNKNLENTNAYPDNSEDYFGASAYYGNFDIVNDGSWNKSVFSSWEEAVEAALGEVYLPTKYSEATAYSNGIEVNYTITFDTYEGSGTYGQYTMTFSVSKDAPNPEFELISFEEN